MADAPPEIERLLTLVGAAATLALVEHYGGTRVHVRTGATSRNRLAEQLGAPAASALAAAFGGEYIRVPLAKAWRAQIYRAQGLSYAAIARRLGCSDVTVWEYLRGARQTAQLDLPLG